MKKQEEGKLSVIVGGNVSITGPVLTGLVNIIKILKDAGYSLGSGIRRISENDLCPLE